MVLEVEKFAGHHIIHENRRGHDDTPVDSDVAVFVARRPASPGLADKQLARIHAFLLGEQVNPLGQSCQDVLPIPRHQRRPRDKTAFAGTPPGISRHRKPARSHLDDRGEPPPRLGQPQLVLSPKIVVSLSVHKIPLDGSGYAVHLGHLGDDRVVATPTLDQDADTLRFLS